MPPTTTIAKTIPATTSRRFATARGRGRLSARFGAVDEMAESMRRAAIRVRRGAGQAFKLKLMIYCNGNGSALYRPAVGTMSISNSRLDRIAIGLSGLCVMHCVATAALLALVASAGAMGSPAIHEVGLTLAMVLGAYALGRGLIEHGFLMPASIGALGLGVMAGAISLPEGGHEAIYTVGGVMILALGHRLNFIAAHHDF